MNDIVHRQIVAKAELFGQLPPEWPEEDLLARIRGAVHSSRRKVVVLDDDPTGSQTVHGIFVRTSWGVAELKSSFAGKEDLFFILTNTRSVTAEKAKAINAEIAHNLCRAATETGTGFTVISRGDSTLRGHYSDELEVLAEVLEKETGVQFDGHILVPAFFEGGRFTVNDIHYVQDGDRLIPAGETEFARDSVFGYRSSHLGRYVEEKTNGRVPAGDVLSIGIDDLRTGGAARVAELLGGASDGRTIIVNAASYRDLEVFVLGLLAAEEAGKRFLVRSSASFVKVRGGISSRPLLTHGELKAPVTANHGGLVVVGSYVGKTGGQIDAACELAELQVIEVEVQRLLDESGRGAEIERVLQQVEGFLRSGTDVMVYTSRTVIRQSGGASDLSIGSRVSAALVEIVSRLAVQPRFLIAKGGITSNDVATDALGVKAAKVLGQAYPGVPVWLLGPETKFPSMPYVVFPGNVGAKDTLADVISLMRGTIDRIQVG